MTYHARIVKSVTSLFCIGIALLGPSIASQGAGYPEANRVWPGLSKLWGKSRQEVFKLIGKGVVIVDNRGEQGMNNDLDYKVSYLEWKSTDLTVKSLPGFRWMYLLLVNDRVAAVEACTNKRPSASTISAFLGAKFPVVLDEPEDRHGSFEGKAQRISLLDDDAKLFPGKIAFWANTDALDRNEVASIQSVQFSGGSDIKAGDFLIEFSRKPDWVSAKVGG
jgi:hypothetical protein